MSFKPVLSDLVRVLNGRLHIPARAPFKNLTEQVEKRGPLLNTKHYYENRRQAEGFDLFKATKNLDVYFP